MFKFIRKMVAPYKTKRNRKNQKNWPNSQNKTIFLVDSAMKISKSQLLNSNCFSIENLLHFFSEKKARQNLQLISALAYALFCDNLSKHWRLWPIRDLRRPCRCAILFRHDCTMYE